MTTNILNDYKEALREFHTAMCRAEISTQVTELYDDFATKFASLPTIVPCNFGDLVSRNGGDGEEYKDIIIDLEKPDGGSVQLCVVGTWSEESFVHAHVWNGDDEDPAWSHVINPNGEECY